MMHMMEQMLTVFGTYASCAVLCCAVLCCAVLCCAVLCCAVLCCAVLCSCSLKVHDCNAQVGQILFHGRISKSNRMLPFTTQIIEVVSAHYPPNLPTPSEATSAVADQIARPTDAVPVRDPESGQAQTSGDTNSQLAQQTAFPGLQVSPPFIANTLEEKLVCIGHQRS